MPYPWTAGDILTAADLNAAIATGVVSTGLGAWASYTPAWTSSGTQPAIGNATVAGNYIKIGRLVAYELIIIFGSTSTYGTGTYLFSLPVAAAGSGRSGGSALVTDATDGLPRARTARIASATTVDLRDAAGVAVAQTVPFTFAQSDQVTIVGTYRSAA